MILDSKIKIILGEDINIDWWEKLNLLSDWLVFLQK